MTISGATVGNDTYTIDNFEDISFRSSAAFDWTTNLVGQNASLGNTGWGDPSLDFNFDDFNFDGKGAFDPTGSAAFTLNSSGLGMGGTDMVLKSMTVGAIPAPVPEPETYMLLGIASAALAYARRRNNKQRQGTAELQPPGPLAA